MGLLETTASIASILTALIAVGAALLFWWDSARKRWKLEAYLKQERAAAKPPKVGRHSVVHLMANLSLTEAEVLHAAFRSRYIKPSPATDRETGLASEILLEYVGPRTQ